MCSFSSNFHSHVPSRRSNWPCHWPAKKTFPLSLIFTLVCSRGSCLNYHTWSLKGPFIGLVSSPLSSRYQERQLPLSQVRWRTWRSSLMNGFSFGCRANFEMSRQNGSSKTTKMSANSKKQSILVHWEYPPSKQPIPPFEIANSPPKAESATFWADISIAPRGFYEFADKLILLYCTVQGWGHIWVSNLKAGSLFAYSCKDAKTTLVFNTNEDVVNNVWIALQIFTDDDVSFSLNESRKPSACKWSLRNIVVLVHMASQIWSPPRRSNSGSILLPSTHTRGFLARTACLMTPPNLKSHRFWSCLRQGPIGCRPQVF